MFRCFFGFLIFFSLVRAVTLDEVLGLALANTYQLEEKWHLLEAARLEKKSLYALFGPRLNASYTASLNIPQNRASYGQQAFNLTGQLNIFNGMQDFYSYKKAGVALNLEESFLDSTKNDLILSTKLAYIQILQLKESIKIAKESIRLLETQLYDTNQFFIYGISDKSALLSIEIKLANAKIDLARLQGALTQNLNLLKKLSGQIFSEDSIEDIDVPEQIAYDKEELLKQIYENNPQFRAKALLSLQQQHERKIRQGFYYPSISLNAQYWHTIGGSSSIPQTQQSRIQFQVTWNLSDIYTAFYRDSSARARLLALEASKADLRSDREGEVASLLNNLELAKQKLIVSKVSLEQAQENYRIVSNRYQENIVNYIELLNAELMLTNAKSEIITSRYEIASNVAKIDHLKNEGF